MNTKTELSVVIPNLIYHYYENKNYCNNYRRIRCNYDMYPYISG